MQEVRSSHTLTRRRFIAKGAALTLLTSAGISILAACGGAAPSTPAAPTTAPAAVVPTTAPAVAPTAAAAAPAAKPAGGKAVEVRAHMVKKQDVSDWIDTGIKQDIDGFKAKNPDISIKLETIPGWTAEYIPKILSMNSAGQLGDAVWYPPRHRSHIAWGVSYNVVRDLTPIAQAAKFDKNQFFAGALEANSSQGKWYWMSYISEPIVPVMAYNKTKIKAMNLDEPSDDWTFDDLAAWAKGATKDGVFGYYTADSGDEPFSGGPYLRQWGVEPVDKDGKKATFMDTKDAFTSALKFRYDLQNTWKVSPSPSSGTIDVNGLYGGQKVLAVNIWPFRIQIYPATFKDFEHGFVLTPTVKKGDKRRSMLNEHVFGLTTASKNPEATFTFLSWICGKEMNVQALVQGQKGPIAREDVWADDRIYQAQPTYKKLRPLMESIEADYVVGNYRGEEFDQAYAQAYDAMDLGKVQPDATAAEIQKLTQAVLDKAPA
jgi:multiple sugar transport system substrate-binding protein